MKKNDVNWQHKKATRRPNWTSSSALKKNWKTLNLFVFLLSFCVTQNLWAQSEVRPELRQDRKDVHFGYCGTHGDYALEHHIKNTSSETKYVAQPVFPAAMIETCGNFRLYYEDIFMNTNDGFDDPSTGLDRRNNFCAVLTYVQSVIQIPSGVMIDIFVDRSLTALNPAGPTDEFLARAGPYFPAGFGSTSGFYAGHMFNHIVSGTDPDVNQYDGHVQVNFDEIGGTTPINYWNNHTVFTPGCSFDLYTVLLHEVTHAMGWLSTVKADGSGNAICSNAANSFSLYDQLFLYQGNITTAGPFTKLVNNVPAVVPGIPVTTNQIWLNNQATPRNHPIYSGMFDPGYPLNLGSILSHLNQELLSFHGMSQYSPGFQPDYVMGPSIAQGEIKRTWSMGELRALRTLGYTYNAAFAASNSLNGVTNNNTLLTANTPAFRSNVAVPVSEYNNSIFADQLTPDFTLVNANTIGSPSASSLTINLASDINLQDPNGDVISIMPNSLFAIRGVSDGLNDHNRLSVNAAGTIITYTPPPGYHGRAQFGFYLWDGKEQGGLKVYTIDVTASGAYIVTLGNQLVINGGFEEGTETWKTTETNKIFTTWRHFRDEGYSAGDHYAGAHPYANMGNNWNIGAGTIVRNTLKKCYMSTTPVTFGEYGTWTTSTDPGLSGISPLPIGSIPNNERFQRLNGGFNFSTLYNQVNTCNYYRFECDLAFATGQWSVGQTFTFDLQFVTDPGTTMTGFTVLQTVPVTVTVTSVFVSGTDNWIHVSADFTYCSTTPTRFINLVAPNSIYVINAPLLDNVSLIQIPTPAAMTVSAGPDATICPPATSTALAATVTNSRCNLTYSWTPTTGLTGATTATPTASPTSTTTYTVTVTDQSGCGVASDQVVVNVGCGDSCDITPKFDYKLDNCTAYFTDFSYATGTIYAWNWEYFDAFGNLIGSSTLQNPSFTFPASGTYKVCLTVEAFNGNEKCKETLCIEIIVDCVPPCEVTPKFDYKLENCTAYFTDYSYATGTIYAWNWQFFDAFGTLIGSSTLQNPSFTFPASGTYKVCLTVTASTANDKCKETLCIEINVDCVPPCEVTPKFDYKLENCTAYFTDYSYATGTIYAWNWQFFDAFGTLIGSSTLQNPSFTFPASGTYKVCLVAYATTGLQKCKEQLCIEINVDCVPPCNVTPKFDYKLDNCTAYFTDYSVATGTIYAWNWQFFDAFGTLIGSSTLQNPSFTFPASGTYKVCLVAYATTGLQKCKEQLCIEINVECKPCDIKADFKYQAHKCKVQFGDMSSAAGPITSWHWDFGDGTSSNVQNPLHIFPGSGTYHVCLTVTYLQNGVECKDTKCYDLTLICPSQVPCTVTAGFNFTGPFGTKTRNFTDLSTTTGTITGWSWTFGDGGTSTLQNPTHTYASFGTYTVCLTVTAIRNGQVCSNQICKTIKVKPGIVNPNDLPNKMTAFPNPTSQDATISLEAAQDATAVVEIFNMYGEMISEIYRGNLEAGVTKELKWNASSVTPGVYLIKANINGEVLQERLVVTK